MDQCREDQVGIKDPQLRNFNLCRDLEYYVNPEGTELIELGTRVRPYKSIQLPFIEILNYMAHQPLDVKVFVKEMTVNYMMQKRNYMINMTSVTIESYTDGKNIPYLAYIRIVNYDINIFNKKTMTNLIVDPTLRLNDQLNKHEITNAEKLIMGDADTALYVHRTNLNINNIDLWRDIAADKIISSSFIRTVYLQHRVVKMTNMSINITGSIIDSYDPMSLHVENVYVDYFGTMAGFVLRSNCNYPEAYNEGFVLLRNVTVENTRRRVAPYLEGIIMHTGAENITVDNCQIKIYGSQAEDKGQIQMQITNNCIPQDDLTQDIEIKNTYMTLTENPNKDRHVQLLLFFEESYPRNLRVKYINNRHMNIVDSYYSMLNAYTTPLTDVWIQNNLFHNVSGVNGAVVIITAKNFVVENEIYEDSTNFGSNAYAFQEVNSVTMRNITISNVNGTGTSTDNYLYMVINNGGFVDIDDWKFVNSATGLQAGIQTEGVLSRLTIKNSKFENIKTGNKNTIISTGEFKHFEMTNTTFSSIESEHSTDEKNFMITIGNINLDDSKSSKIEDVSIELSKISFLLFNTITGNPTKEVNFNINNVKFSNCNYSYIIEKNLIQFGNLETQADITFSIENLEFNSISFKNKGNLLKFEQQIKNPLVLNNIVIKNVDHGIIHIESANKQRLEVETKVIFENSTFQTINANYDSFITIREGGNLEIINGEFSGISCVEEGAVLFAGYRRTTTVIRNSTFTNNTAITGGIFNVESESVVKVYDSVITINFAVNSGVIHSSSNGYFEFYNTGFLYNYAVSASISQVLDVSTTSIVDN